LRSKKVNTTRVFKYKKDERASWQRDQLVIEEPLEMRVTFWVGDQQLRKNLSVTMRTPGDDFALTAGFLFAEGVVHEKGELLELNYCLKEAEDRNDSEQHFNIVNAHLRKGLELDMDRFLRHFYTSSSCGVCGKASLEALALQGVSDILSDDILCSVEVLELCRQRLEKAQETFELTGGLHAAALFDKSGELICLREDVGRHNALDKLIGTLFLRGFDAFHESILLLSGRSSFELVQKALVAGIPIVAGVGAPSSLAVDLAKRFGLTLLGFLRQERCNVYSNKQRISFL